MDDDFAMPSTPIGSFSLRNGFYMPARQPPAQSNRHGRAGSPPLEKDEKEFTQTADGLQKRKLFLNNNSSSPAGGAPSGAGVIDLERDEGSLFGAGAGMVSFVSSPAIRPSTMMSLGGFGFSAGRKEGDGGIATGWAKFEGMLEWDRSPESIALEELDGLLDDY